MESLSARDRELVALGAALASNCVPCIEYHVPEARKAGLSDEEIGEAIALSDKVRKVPADKVLNVAQTLVGKKAESPRNSCSGPGAQKDSATARGCCI